MIVIVLVCIATAALFARLALELGRLAIGDFRVPRPAIGLLRTPGRTRDVTRPSGRHEPAPAAEDVEQLVRDRLYGERNGALRRPPARAD